MFALIQARVQVFSQIRFQWARFKGTVPGDLFGTDDLAILERPWPNGHTAQLLAKMEIDNSIGGNCYIVRARKDRLARLRPDLVTICLGSQYDMASPADAPDVEVAGYAYFPRSGKPQWYWPWELGHYAPIPDPNFQFLGMSWMTPLLREVQADALMTEHKYRYFANAATPNLAVKFDPQVGLETVKAFKDLLDNEHRGAFSAYKCAAPETLVTMWDGRRLRADEVRAGDVVTAWADGRAVPGVITRSEWQPASPIVTVTTQRGRVLRTTRQHPYLARRVVKRYVSCRATVLSDEEWVDAADLRPGDLVRVGLGWARDDVAPAEIPPDHAVATADGGCGFEGCPREAHARGWCKMHYERWRRHGDARGTVGVARWSRITGELTPYHAWVLGAITGDGSTVATSPVISAWDAGIQDRFAVAYELARTGGEGYNYRVKGLRSLLVECGLNGKRAWEKTVPAVIMSGENAGCVHLWPDRHRR